MSNGQNLSGRAAREEREKRLLFSHRFGTRITLAKFGKQSLDAGDYGSALKKFIEYLGIIAEAKGVKDLYSIKINNFDDKKEITEMLMISHIYFEMARMYDAVPKFAEESKKCLDQFVHFTANQPYQVVNSEIARKYLKKSQFKNPVIFREAYQQIFVQSKKCYVVTFCYGEDHYITKDFRLFKDWLLEFDQGQKLVSLYYRISSTLVSRWQDNLVIKTVSFLILRPALLLFSKVILPLIIKKC